MGSLKNANTRRDFHWIGPGYSLAMGILKNFLGEFEWLARVEDPWINQNFQSGVMSFQPEIKTRDAEPRQLLDDGLSDSSNPKISSWAWVIESSFSRVETRDSGRDAPSGKRLGLQPGPSSSPREMIVFSLISPITWLCDFGQVTYPLCV